MPKRKRVFYAFPSQPPVLGETITTAIEMLRNRPKSKNDQLRFTPWTDMSVGGRKMVSTILDNIDKSDVFACDLTYPNTNVSFELGYAIGRFKRIWISLDTTIADAEQRYRRAYFGLIGSGYAEYRNASDLVSAFLDEDPAGYLNNTLLGNLYRSPMARQELPTALYVKPPINTDAVIAATETIENSIFGESLIIDDPVENPSPTLEWYAGKLGIADAVLFHLLGDNQVGQLDHNVKCSIVAGVSRGLNRSMLMMAQKPYETPVDYQGILKLHDTASECRTAVRDWMDSFSEAVSRRRPRRPEGQTTGQRSLDLRRLALGEPVAENERQRLDSYFVETSTYTRAMDDPLTIVVGRKGSGKSAQLYAMEVAANSDRRNHVCVIKPVGYEVDGLVRVLQSIVEKSERGYLIESLWKFLIYSELAQNTYSLLASRPPYLELSQAESQFLEYYTSNTELLSPPFSERLDITIRSLDNLDKVEDAIGQRRRISELLHSNQLRDLRSSMGNVLTNFNKVVILIDNLDAPWGANSHVEQLSELLWGLLQVSDDITAEFGKQDSWRASVNVNLTVFLRSDIFSFIQPTASEQDKLPILRIVWDDPSMLKRLINLRLEFGSGALADASTIWDRLFPVEVAGKPTWNFALDTVLPRPRDIVYLMRDAIDRAINRGHDSVTDQDFLDARNKYSEYVLRSILAEDDPRKGRLEAVLYEFAGCNRIVTRTKIEDVFALAQVDPGDHDFYIDLLCDVNFLAIQSGSGYRYATDEADRSIARRVAMQVASNRNQEESYQVSSAFWSVLEIE